MLASLVGGFFGSFLAGYLKKKGENLATHEDIQNLVEQVQAVTTATQEIESRISGELWDRQKKWELRRDIIFETTRAVADVKHRLNALDSLHQVVGPNPQREELL